MNGWTASLRPRHQPPHPDPTSLDRQPREVYVPAALGERETVPGWIVCVPTFGSAAHLHPHRLVVKTDGLVCWPSARDAWDMITARMLSEQRGATAHVNGEMRYAAQTWERERRVICKAEVIRHTRRDPRDNSR